MSLAAGDQSLLLTWLSKELAERVWHLERVTQNPHSLDM